MTKLGDLLQRNSRVQTARMGFGSAPSKRPPTVLLAGLVSERWAHTIADAAAAGADLFLLTGQPNEKELKEAVSAAEDRPCGLLTPQPSTEEVAQLRQAGLDFVVLAPEAPAAALQDQELAVLLHVNDEITDIQLRTIDPLPLNAIYLESNATPLTIQRQMELQRISGMARKPLLLQVPPDTEQQDLLCLRDAGVALVALDLKERAGLEALRRIRGVIDTLPSRRRPGRDERPEVTIPRAAATEPAEEEEEEHMASTPEVPL